MKIFGIAGFKNSGKTELITRLVRAFKAQGLRVATIKHAHHSADIDHIGTDSHRHREAGANEVMLISKERWALMNEGATLTLNDALLKLSECDLALIEGFKYEAHPKIFCHRASSGAFELKGISARAIASDEPIESPLPQFHLDDIEKITAFILKNADEF